MGVDARIYLPGNVRIGDVSKVIGKLLGLKAVRTHEKEHPPGFVDVEGVKLRAYTDTLFGCVHIDIEGVTGPALKYNFGSDKTSYLYQYESDHGSDHVMLARSRCLNLAVFRGLVDFFGGYVEYNDYDSQPPAYAVQPRCNALNQPNDGALFWNLQKRIFELQPLTEQGFINAEKYAAYQFKEE
jgi:hypothetical protein